MNLSNYTSYVSIGVFLLLIGFIMISLLLFPSSNGGFKEKIKNRFAMIIPSSRIKVTERRLMNTSNELERFKVALDHHAIVGMTDKNGTIIYVNDKFAEISQYTKDELIGKNFRIVNSGQHSDSFFQKMWQTISNGEIMKGEIVNRKKDGTLYFVDATIVPFLDQTGEPYQYVSIQNDITENKYIEKSLERAKEEAESANNAKSEFLSRMSHELRTPMNAILGFAQLLDSDPIDSLSESQIENVREIIKAGEHLLTLINEVLDLSKIESGNITLSIESVDIHSVIDNSISLIQPIAKKYKVHLIQSCDKERTFVMADKIRLQQVLINLISNAIKYNREGGTVEVSCQKDQNTVRIHVIDTGIGIPSSNRSELFKPFSRLGAENTATEGTGIGLNISKKLVELMHGTIDYQSEESIGSDFFIELPIGNLQEIEINLKDFKNRNESNGEDQLQQKVIIYIEDNPVNLDLVNRILTRRPNVKLVSAPNAVIGLELIGAQKVDLVLLDINLPGLNGYEILKALKVDEDTSEIPVIALSASAMQRDIEKGLEAGFKHYLTKPINVKEFLATIDKYIQIEY